MTEILLEEIIKENSNNWKSDHFHENTISDFEKYMNEVGSHRILEQEETDELVKKYQENEDINAMNELIMCNQKLISYFINRLYPTFHNKMWLVACGNDGLRNAIKKYDPEKNIKFSTFAGHGIMWGMQSGLGSELMVEVPLPAGRYQQIKKLKRLIDEYVFKDESLTEEKISEKCNWGILTVKKVLHDYNAFFSNESISLDSIEYQPKEEKDKTLIETMLKGLAQLPEKFKFTLKKYYGIDCKPVNDLKKLGNALAKKRYIISYKKNPNQSYKARAGQIKDEAIKLLRIYLSREMNES